MDDAAVVIIFIDEAYRQPGASYKRDNWTPPGPRYFDSLRYA
jgi:hypothetical protein